MKAITYILAAFLATAAAADSPRFVTPSMIDRRNGLTDAQYEYLWAIGRNPQISQKVARDWVFRASRYQNVTNWLDLCGRSNDFARLSYSLQDWNFNLRQTNVVLVASNSWLRAECSKWITESESWSNAYVIADGLAKSAQGKIDDEIADLQSKITKYEEYKTKYPLLKTVWNALITDAQNRIKILQALTGTGAD